MNAKTVDGELALHEACKLGHDEAVTAILKEQIRLAHPEAGPDTLHCAMRMPNLMPAELIFPPAESI